MLIYSHSKITTFESCPQKFKFQYLDRIPAEIESVEAFLGSRVHEALEKLYRMVQDGATPTEQQVLDHFDAQWDAHWSEAVRIVEEGLQPEHYRNVGRQCISDYYRRYYPFRQGRVIALEKEVTILLDPAGQYRMMGYIDRVDKIADGVFEIHDYKTNRSLPSQLEKDQDRQLALYEIGLRDYLGEQNVREVTLVWHYLRFDQEIRSRRTEQELEQLRATMIAKIQQIEAARAADDFPPHESHLCQWCEYRSICPLWKHLYVTAVPAGAMAVPVPADDGATLVNRLAELDRRRKDLNQQLEQLRAEQDQLREAIVQYARQHGLQRLFGAERTAVVRRKIEWEIPTKSDQPAEYEQMIRLLRSSEFWAEVTDFSAAKLRSLLDKPEAEPVRALLAALVRQQEHWDVSLQKKTAQQ